MNHADSVSATIMDSSTLDLFSSPNGQNPVRVLVLLQDVSGFALNGATFYFWWQSSAPQLYEDPYLNTAARAIDQTVDAYGVNVKTQPSATYFFSRLGSGLAVQNLGFNPNLAGQWDIQWYNSNLPEDGYVVLVNSSGTDVTSPANVTSNTLRASNPVSGTYTLVCYQGTRNNVVAMSESFSLG